MSSVDHERQRLEEAHQGFSEKDWKRWGPYLSERAWGTVREDYSAFGDAWNYFPHEAARSRVYRWNEDGLGGICDNKQRLCFALSLWNGKDRILKERAFGLTGVQGNHGEDGKELYYYLDSTPTHSYMKYLYKYTQKAYPYEDLVTTSVRRSKRDFEYELLDTGAFEQSRYWDVFVEYAKADTDDILIKITVANRGPEEATIDVMPTLWFRNVWAWGFPGVKGDLSVTPDITAAAGHPVRAISARHEEIGVMRLVCEGEPDLLFTENESNFVKLYGDKKNPQPYVKDAFHEYVVHGNKKAINPKQVGTKAAARYTLTVPSGKETVIKLRLTERRPAADLFGPGYDHLIETRVNEADAFFNEIGSPELSEDARRVQRQAFAGMMWSKQFYKYDVRTWLNGDPAYPPPPPARKTGRNSDWTHVHAADIISMPDAWEYPWFAAWDLAFHCIPIAVIDPQFAKEQLLLLCHEWYQHPNGQLPAYEYGFGDVNPPVQAWAALRVFQIERRVKHNKGDYDFLQKIFHKLLLNFTWWVNRKDAEGKNIFQGGFLGLDNIGVFDRSRPLPTGGYLEQSDGTSWMAMYCLNMLSMSLELTHHDPAYEDMATKFFEHFVYIAHAMNNFGEMDEDLWDETDGFYYDVLHRPDGSHQFLKIRSMVGLIPLLAVETMDEAQYETLKDFKSRVEWFIRERPDLCANVADLHDVRMHDRRLLSIVNPDRLKIILTKMLDETEFLSPHGLRALSRYHKDNPFVMKVDGTDYRVDYEPSESSTALFGGNSNWRGPIWWPLNFLLIEALQKFDYYLGPDFLIPFPTGSKQMLSLGEIAAELSRRLTRTFLRDETGNRPVHGGNPLYKDDPHWKDLILFYEYFHGDNGAGLGASHQTGWTGLVAKLIEQSGE